MERFYRDSDDEDVEAIPIRSELQPKNVNKEWDKAPSSPPAGETQAFEDNASYILLLKALKLLAYVISFVLILFGIVISKSAFLLMTSQLDPKRRVPFCDGHNKNLEANIMEEERISWSWAIFFCFVFPELLVFLRAIRIWMFKATFRPSFLEFFVPACFETCYSFGLSILAFIVLPSMNIIRGVMLTSALCLLPTVFSMLSRRPGAQDSSSKENMNISWLFLSCIDAISALFLLVGLTVWPIFNDEPSGRAWLLPVCCVLISCGWWENYADKGSLFKLLRMLGHINVARSRYTTYIFLPFWKILVFLSGMAMPFWLDGQDYTILFSKLTESFQRHKINYTEIRQSIPNENLTTAPGDEFYGQVQQKDNAPYAIFYVMGFQIIAALITYLTGKFACKIGIQNFSFAFPISLGVPLTLLTLTSFCGFREKNVCFLEGFFPPYLYWECPTGSLLQDFMLNEHGWVWFLWFLSSIWISLHIWNGQFRRLERAEILFVTPMYCGLLIDQSLAFNKRRGEIPEVSNNEEEEEDENTGRSYKELKGNEDTIPKIYACATMWHEIKSEMKEMLKSIFRMDEDQASRRIARKYFAVMDPDYYELETHIFFDDAFNKSGTQVNSYVKDLVNTLEEAASQIHETVVKLVPPKKYPTPYGGRLEWILPGGTKLFVHLKNKDKIRHKKRWSQVMYMYYLLGHRLLSLDIPFYRKQNIAENTFLLALDGDIDFKPQAVLLLVDLMKKNKELGAACGRIHPIGSGLMVWYQKFEYAIGHWFQKATEHVIGCVLCSPGCFSLFRAETLLDENVMAKYTTKATEPRHFVQYDQGEDRWLCTLMLQRGWRVEYCAAADALTHCPEQFNEFFTQRRRWVPSTMANIFDLLVDYKQTIRLNPNISYPYVAYQMLMMIGSILGPGTIFLMLIGAFNAAFNIPNWDCFLWNIFPVALFILVCFFAESQIQLMVAQILSAGYALIMVAVVVALLIQIQDDGPTAPSSLFLFGVATSFIIAAILHPLEFGCLPHGLVYYITIPAMYLLLIIYSLMNLHVVSWGTREVAEDVTPDKAAVEAAKKKEEEKKSMGLLSYFLSKNDEKSEGSFELSFAGLFKLMCCTKPVEEKFELTQIASSLADINKRLDSMERQNGSILGERRFSIASGATRSVQQPILEEDEEYEQNDTASYESEKIKIEKKRDDSVNPEWIDDPDLQDGEVDFLTGHELKFWREMIDKYLLPLDKDEKTKKKIAEDLIQLRNKVIFFFFMVNAVFVVAIFLLQNEKETIYVDWPLGRKYNMTYLRESADVQLQETSLRLEPIGVVFVAVFALILFIQFTAMLIHRFGTFCHILAFTPIEFCNRDVESVAKDTAFEKEGLNMIKQIQKLKNKNGDIKGRKSRAMTGDVARRKTLHNIERSHHEDIKPANIENTFNKTFKELSQSTEKVKLLSGRRETRVTFQNLARRRSSVLERKASTIAEVRRKSMIGGLENPANPRPSILRVRHSSSNQTFHNPAFDAEEI